MSWATPPYGWVEDYDCTLSTYKPFSIRSAVPIFEPVDRDVIAALAIATDDLEIKLFGP